MSEGHEDAFFVPLTAWKFTTNPKSPFLLLLIFICECLQATQARVQPLYLIAGCLSSLLIVNASMEDNLPPGYRFYPTEEELVAFYLHNKLQGRSSDRVNKVIPDIAIYDFEPSQLPKLAGEMCRGDTEQWFFFSPRQEREARGGRPSRSTACGYWKATGSPGYVYSSDNVVIGLKKTMVYYRGKAPSGRKTKWKMNEYRAIESSHQSSISAPTLRHEFSLCRIYVISGSFRAFDRRPLDSSSTSGYDHNTRVGESSSLGTSFPVTDGGGSRAVNNEEGEPLCWDWEHFTCDASVSYNSNP